jgi:hypothetical protein
MRRLKLVRVVKFWIEEEGKKKKMMNVEYVECARSDYDRECFSSTGVR